MTGPTESEAGSGAAIALLLVQVVVGYEWLVSGLTKLVHGDFPSGLARTVAELAKGSPGWYGSFLTDAVAPRATLFGYAIEWSELAVGLVLLTGAAASLRPGGRPPAWLAPVTTAALVVGLVLAVDFELANGGTFGLRLASDSFGGGIDLDTIMIGLQLALLVPATRGLRRSAAAGSRRPAPWRAPRPMP